MDFTVQRCTRHCSKTNQEFKPDEVFYSALVYEGAQVVRKDFCVQAWEGPPAGELGWWKSQMPGKNTNRYNLAPNDILLQYFEELEGQPDKADVRYVMALLLVRRRIARLEEAEETGDTDEGHEQIVLYCPKKEKTYHVRVALPDETRAQQVQDELADLLFANAE